MATYSLCLNLGGVDPEKLYRVTLKWIGVARKIKVKQY